MNRPWVVMILCLLAVAVGAFAIRLPRLALRPMHGDEACQARKAGDLWEQGVYVYDATQHHGPTLYYLTLPSLWLSGAQRFADTDETAYRIVPVVFGVGLVLLAALVADGIGRAAAVIAAMLTAISPAMVFYSRYYVQEMLLVFFTALAIAAAWRYTRTRSAGWAVAAGAAVGLMHATKETWVLAAAAMAGGLVLTWLWTRWRDGGKVTLLVAGVAPQGCATAGLSGRVYRDAEGARPACPAVAHVAAALIAAAVVSVALYSSFGTHWRGPWDSILAYTTYVNRAGGDNLHDHPWYTYLEWLFAFRPARGFFWSEGLIAALALAGFVAALARRGLPDAHRPLARFLAFYTLLLTVLYAAIPYKTPWCALSFLHGMILLAGVGAWALLRALPGKPLKVLAGAVLVAAAVHLGWQSYRLNYRFYTDPRNPYVYAHPTSNLLDFAAMAERLARVSPQGHDTVIKVIAFDNYWPLPWYLRRFNPDRVGWYRGEVPEDPNAPIIVLAALAQDFRDEARTAGEVTLDRLEAAIEKQLRGPYNRQAKYGLRPGVLLALYVQEDLWQAFLAAEGGGAPTPPASSALPPATSAPPPGPAGGSP
jgi:uncharacterized protein (TIGR03663 family)